VYSCVEDRREKKRDAPAPQPLPHSPLSHLTLSQLLLSQLLLSSSSPSHTLPAGAWLHKLSCVEL